MKYRFLLQSILASVLMLGIAVYAGRVLRLTGDWYIDPGGEEIGSLAPATIDFLEELDERLAITYFASSRERMPSHLKEVEEGVRRLLAAMRERAPERIDYRVIDPERSGAAGIVYAARKKASAFSVRRVRQDEHGEQKIWSSLILAYGNRPERLIQGIENAHLPYLEKLIIAQLKGLERPPRPVFAVAAPPTFRLLPAFLGEYGDVIEIDLERQTTIPPEADVLFWMQPATATPEHARQLRRFVDSGRSAILAGSAYAVGYLPEADKIRYIAQLLPTGWEDLLRPFGLRPLPDLLMDRNNGPVFIGEEGGGSREVIAPFHLRCLPAFYDMKSFVAPARGGLNFVAASALEIDPRRLSEIDFQAEIIGTTTENARVASLPSGSFEGTDLASGLPVPKQNLMVLLKTDDPWRGQLLTLASASPFQDGIINQPGYAHRIFLRTLVRTFTEPHRLVRARVERREPERLPPMGSGARTFWRFAAAFLVPLLFLAGGIWRYVGGGRLEMQGTIRPAIGALLGIAAVLLIGQLGRLGAGLYLDLTADRLNRPAALTRQLLAAAPDLEAELLITPRGGMPPPLKKVEGQVRSVLNESGIELTRIRPDQLSAQERAALEQQGLRPFPVEQVVEDAATVREVWSGLRLRRGARSAVIPRLDERTTMHLEFLLAAALDRLERGAGLDVAVISDLPRLSPAEALEDYHRQGLIPPSGVDVYSEVKSLLADYGYRVTYVNPRDPQLPDEVDLILWLQPRRDSMPIMQLLGGHLANGGRAIVALQHFNIQQRQYRGSGFQTVYWPQPQFQDLDRYLRLFGVEQVREVLMDRTQSHLDLETQVNRTAVREYDPQKVALPFLIRAVGDQLSSTSPITRRLGDLLFIWGNRFALDEERLERYGLRSRPLITSSDRAWSYPWKGGWLPPQVFSSTDYLPGRQPLATLLEGRFPALELQESESGSSLLTLRPPATGAAEGALLLIGSSEMFKDDYLYAPDFQHDQFLLNAVAWMAHGEELATLQARRPTARGFSFQSPATKTTWRLAAVWTGPLLFLLYGLFRHLYGRRPARLS